MSVEIYYACVTIAMIALQSLKGRSKKFERTITEPEITEKTSKFIGI